MRCDRNGRSRAASPLRRSGLTRKPTDTGRAGPVRPLWSSRNKEICQTRVRFGYQRVHVLLRREGWAINQKKTYRLYKGLGMQLRNKSPKRRVKAKERADRAEAVGPNDVWAMSCTTGQKIRVLTVVDTFARYSPALDVRYSYRGEGVVATLE
jgi:putative transposase